MFDRFVSSMNNAWQSTKKAVAESVEFAKDNTTRTITVSDPDVQRSNDTYDSLISAIKTITLKVELLEAQFLMCAQHLKSIATVFSVNLPEGSADHELAQKYLNSVMTFERTTRNLVDHLLPQYVLQPFIDVQKELAAFKETRDAVHKLALDIDLLNMQVNAPVTKQIVGKMHKIQAKLESMRQKLQEAKPDYLEKMNGFSQNFKAAQKNAILALQFYEQQYLQTVEKYIINHAAKPTNPPFTDYSDMTSILPNYLQLLSSKAIVEDDE